MGVTWGDIGTIRRMLQNLPSKFFKELEGLLGHMWPSVVLEKHYPIRELARALVVDGLAFCGLGDAQFFTYRQFNSNFARGDPMILPYELIHSRNRGTVGHNVCLPRAWQVLDVYASRLIRLTPPEYGSPCEALLSVHLFHPQINL
ncbi:hypothetical protein AVEN_266340-1 [Araneus ventricosus]|uniref:Uncharacterized protein n=1 Tax=Araneus ventricosus TaxID=182803 RepID=A0A4Y2CPQ1_ARAVE|nr:hypothetical protein AVEN_266340-1 [Araneus ventricosus]